MKSVCGSGRYKYFCFELPNPTPNKPPLFKAMYPLHTWFPLSNSLSHGLLKSSLSFCLSLINSLPVALLNTNAITTSPSTPLILFVLI